MQIHFLVKLLRLMYRKINLLICEQQLLRMVIHLLDGHMIQIQRKLILLQIN